MLLLGTSIVLLTGCGSTLDGLPDLSPTNSPEVPSVTLTGHSRSVHVAWSPNVESGTSYFLLRKPTAGGAEVQIGAGALTSPYDDTTVTNGVSYTYRVRAARGLKFSHSLASVVAPDVEWSAFPSTSFDAWRESLATVRAAGVTAAPSVSFISSPGVSHEYGALASNGKIYTVPWGGTAVGKIDPVTDTFSTLATAVPSGNYLRPILAPNGNLYVFGLDSGLTSFRINPNNDSITMLVIPAYNGARSFWGAALGKNGKIYVTPAGFGASGRVLEYDPATETSAYRFPVYNSPDFSYTFPTYGADGYLYFVPRIAGRALQRVSFDTGGVASLTNVATPTVTYQERPLVDLFGGLLMAFPTNEYTSTYEGTQRFSSGNSDWTGVALYANALQGRHVCLAPNEKYYWVNGNNKITEYDPRLDTAVEISTGEVQAQSDHSTHYDCVVGPNGDIFWGGGYGSAPKVMRLRLHLALAPKIDTVLYPFWH